MNTPEKEIKELEKCCRKSKNAIPFYAVSTVIGVGFILLAKTNIWQTIIILLLTAGYLIANIFNLIYSQNKLYKIAKEKGGTPCS